MILVPNVNYVKNQKTLQREKAEKFLLSKENNKREWEEIYRKNKKKREIALVKVQDQNKITKESRKENKVRKIKEKEKCIKRSRKCR